MQIGGLVTSEKDTFQEKLQPVLRKQTVQAKSPFPASDVRARTRRESLCEGVLRESSTEPRRKEGPAAHQAHLISTLSVVKRSQ